jgi:hypothetical protein
LWVPGHHPSEKQFDMLVGRERAELEQPAILKWPAGALCEAYRPVTIV